MNINSEEQETLTYGERQRCIDVTLTHTAGRRQAMLLVSQLFSLQSYCLTDSVKTRWEKKGFCVSFFLSLYVCVVCPPACLSLSLSLSFSLFVCLSLSLSFSLLLSPPPPSSPTYCLRGLLIRRPPPPVQVIWGSLRGRVMPMTVPSLQLMCLEPH